MQQQTVLLGALILIVGFGSGYLIGINKKETTPPPMGMHMMHDGEMMGDNTMSMSDMMRDMNAALRGKSGDELDRAFIDEMIVHHEGAVEMAQILVDGTNRPELVQLGNEIITAQTEEIEMMKRWREEWFSR